MPQPASCQLSSIAPLGTHPGGYQIGLECSDPLVQEHFAQALRAAGLEETDRLVSDTGQVVELTLQDSEITVRCYGVVETHFTFAVWPGTA